MPLRDVLLTALICLCWGMSGIIGRIVVGMHEVPPFFFSAVRSCVVLLATLPWLLPMPRPRRRVILIALLLGSVSFTMIFLALRTATPSTVGIVSQIQVPITTVLALTILRERLDLRQIVGILLSLAGVVIVIWDPATMKISTGLLWVVGSAISGSVGAIMLKQIEQIKPLQLQAWAGATAIVPVGLLSLFLETNQVEAAREAGWIFVVGLLLSALVVSVFAHTAYYGLIRRNDAAVVAPMLTLAPIFTIILGVLITHDPMNARLFVGSAVVLAGVLAIVAKLPVKAVLTAHLEG
jgi:drug/metabolite transporter (DMT)-like permease